MSTQGVGSPPEAALNQWLGEPDPGRSAQQLEFLLARHAQPLVRRIVGFKLGSSDKTGAGRVPQADIEDVCQNALCQLLARLERMKSGERSAPVHDFAAYAAVTAYNACNAYFRAKRPAWLSVSMKVRYVATHARKFALWEGPEGADVCGLASHRGQRPIGDAALLAAARDSLRSRIDPCRLPMAQLVEELLTATGGPLIFESLVDAVADLTGLQDERVQSLEEAPGGRPQNAEPLRDKALPADMQMIHRNYIRRVWQEIAALPLEHRRALLLNLNDSAGGDIRLFDSLGIASVREIAAVLEMKDTEFANLWSDLPLDDARLAGLLGMSRQDVANRRSAARKRLARRLQEAEGEI